MSRICDRIEWLEGVIPACEREMLRRWKKKVERAGKPSNTSSAKTTWSSR
jgi:hypothetical protein